MTENVRMLRRLTTQGDKCCMSLHTVRRLSDLWITPWNPRPGSAVVGPRSVSHVLQTTNPHATDLYRLCYQCSLSLLHTYLRTYVLRWVQLPVLVHSQLHNRLYVHYFWPRSLHFLPNWSLMLARTRSRLQVRPHRWNHSSLRHYSARTLHSCELLRALPLRVQNHK